MPETNQALTTADLIDMGAWIAAGVVIPTCGINHVFGNPTSGGVPNKMGPLFPSSLPGACDCYYRKAANGVTACTLCQKHADCPISRPVCSFGFCEAN